MVVDATLEPGELVYGELVVPGETDEEVIVTSHVCHPSLANDNLSGIAVAVELARGAAACPAGATPTGSSSRPARSGRSPGSAATPTCCPRIRHGLVLTGLGGRRPAGLQADPAR